MNTQAIGHSPGVLIQAAKHMQARPKAGHVNKADRMAAPTTKAGAADKTRPIAGADPSPKDETGGERAKGVLRLLEAGHFKGVADVRLRINFFDELSAGAGADAARVAREESATLAETIRAAVDDMVAELGLDSETEDLVAELVMDFGAAIIATADEIQADTRFNAGTLTEAIQSAFDTLVGRLTKSLSTKGSEAPDPDKLTPDAADELEEEPPLSFEEAIASLVSVFDDALSSLVSAVNEVSRPPDPSPPSGNGAAYEKFLAIYEELRGGANSVDEHA